jgi:uroporphyrinogen-III synthase
MSGLAGKRIVVTRAPHQAGELSELLEQSGATPLEVPVIEIHQPADGGKALASALQDLDTYDWIVFTSINTVERVGDVAPPMGVKVAAIGTGTQAALEAHGWHVDLVPVEFVAESLVDAFPTGNGKVLLPRAAKARNVLPSGLKDLGWSVSVVTAYETVDAPVVDEAKAALAGADAITFTASSTVGAFCRTYGIAMLPPVVACIGPVTAETAREFGIEPSVVAREHTIEGLVEALAVSL